MGYDVYGRKPKGPKGEYFRNNVWWWRRLWRYCCDVGEGLISDELAHAGTHNDGEGLQARDASALAKRLYAELESGRTRAHAEQLEARMRELEDPECSICAGTGKRAPPPNRGAGELPCNGCDSTGRGTHMEKMYPFSEENVREFADFVAESGGFKIL